MQYRPEIDGLRAIAVSQVVFFHADFPIFQGGFVGVDVFFVISGFLITSIIIKEIDQGRFSYVDFYERRARRLLPALSLVSIFSAIGSMVWLLPGEALKHAQSLIFSTAFTSNVFFVFQGGYFNQNLDYQPLLHTWSLSVEEQYYLIFPAIFVFLWRHLRLKVFMLLAAAAVSSFAFVEILAAWGYRNATFYLLPTRGSGILIGSILALPGALPEIRERFGKATHNILSTLGLSLVAAASIIFDRNTTYPGHPSLIPILGTVLIIIFATRGTIAEKTLKNSALVFLGSISYSIYLWHQPVISFAKYRHQGEAPISIIALALFLVAAASILTWKYIENPFRRTKGPVERKRFFAAICGICVITIGIGAGGILSNGWNFRFSEEDNKVFDQYINYGSYIRSKFNSLEGQDFDSNPDTSDVLIIGDSFAQDLVNALFESGLDSKFSISTHYINARCGVLFGQDLQGALTHIPERDHTMCDNRRNSKRLIGLLASAEEVWLASNWEPWTMDYLAISERNLQKMTEGKLTFFGRKSFGARNITDYLSSDSVEELLVTKTLENDHREVCRRMPSHIGPQSQYVDVSVLMCGSYDSCSNNDGHGLPISPDGSHLTPAGARMFGEKLRSVSNLVPTSIDHGQ